MKAEGNQGFTLIELAIVLVIIGLLVGGVLGGRELIRQAEMSRVVSDVNRYKTVVNTFKMKYRFLPGDLPNAYAYWGPDCGADTISASSGCNGTGNGLIEWNIGTLKAWRQLAWSEIIEGNFDPPWEHEMSRYQEGTLDGSYYVLSNGWPACGDKQSCLHISGYNAARYPNTSILTGADAFALDNKMDDGRPSMGSVRSYSGTGGGVFADCIINHADHSKRRYNLSSDVVSCYLAIPVD